MERDFSVKLVDRTEVVEYRDQENVYRFDLGKSGKEWVVYLPPSKDILRDDVDKVLNRVTSYLAERRWFGLFKCKYTVRIEHKRDVE